MVLADTSSSIGEIPGTGIIKSRAPGANELPIGHYVEDKLLKDRRLPLTLGAPAVVDQERGAGSAVAPEMPRSAPRLRRFTAGARIWPEFLLLLGLCAFVFFFRLGEPSLWDNSEPEYAATALEMVQTGNWITPHFNGQPVFVHPPLYYWLTALSFQFLGVSEFSARLCSALFALGSVLLVFRIALSLFNTAIALYASFIMATFMGHIAIARLAFLDTALNFFVLLAFSFFLAASTRPTLLRWLGFWSALGLAVLSKGPVGFVMPWLVLLPFLFQIRRLTLLADRSFWLASLAFPALVLPWFILEVRSYGLDFLRTYFAQFTVGRFLGVIMNQSGPWYYYLVSLVPLAFPWCAWGAGAIHQLYRRRRETSSLFVLLGIAVPFLFFSCAQTKMPWYIITIYPFLAIALAQFFYDWEIAGTGDPVLLWHGRLGLVALLAVSLTAHLKLPVAVMDLGYPEAILLLPLTGIALTGGLLAAGRARSSCRAAFTASVATMVVLILFITTWIIPETEKYKRRSLSLQLAALAAPQDRVGMYDAYGPTIPFYGRHRVDLVRQDVPGICAFLGDGSRRTFYLLPLPVYRDVRARGRGPLALLALENDFALVVNQAH